MHAAPSRGREIKTKRCFLLSTNYTTQRHLYNSIALCTALHSVLHAQRGGPAILEEIDVIMGLLKIRAYTYDMYQGDTGGRPYCKKPDGGNNPLQ